MSSSAVGPVQTTPALLTRMSTGRPAGPDRLPWRPAEISRDEAGLAAVGVDGAGYRCAAGFAAVHDDLGAVTGQSLGGRPSESSRRPGDQRAQALQVTVVVHVLSCG